MKYIITESKLENTIHSYLTAYIHPDYNWGPELHDFYREDVKKYGLYEFLINDDIAYTYHGYTGFKDGDVQEIGLLYIEKWLGNNLSSMFGNFWVPVFKSWFEDNSGLKVKRMVVGNEEIN